MLHADLVQVMQASQHPLLAQLAVGIAAAQDKRGSQTVGNRFREQLQDLITRLDQCAFCGSSCLESCWSNAAILYFLLFLRNTAALQPGRRRCIHHCQAALVSSAMVNIACLLLETVAPLWRRTELHFVRCIKPNGLQVAATFDAPLTLHQLRCCGVLEVTRIARAGYPTRYLHRQFAERYHVLLHGAGAGARL